MTTRPDVRYTFGSDTGDEKSVHGVVIVFILKAHMKDIHEPKTATNFSSAAQFFLGGSGSYFVSTDMQHYHDPGLLAFSLSVHLITPG